MHLPEELKLAIEEIVKGKKIPHISQAREELTERYKASNSSSEFITSDRQREAYIVSRMPATYAVVKRVMEEIAARAPEIKPKTLLDLGAGPGTVAWAVAQIFSDMDKATLIEKDRDFISIGKTLAARGSQKILNHLQWNLQNLETLSELKNHDLLVLSYAIGELKPEAISPLIEKCWNATNQLLVIIEPGTPAGFERIRSVRSQLIALGGNMIAPCPHMLSCPMTGDNWCHFSERLARTSLHRQIKGGELGYEDEKYSYVAFCKNPIPLIENRVLRHPLKRSGHVVLYLCVKEWGLKQEVVSKRNPELYRQAKNVDWGDPFPCKAD